MSAEDEFDSIPDEFADLQDVNWSEILSCPPSLTTTTTQTGLHSTVTQPALADPPSPDTRSSTSYSWDDLDTAAFAELDSLERQLTQRAEGPSQATASSSSILLPPDVSVLSHDTNDVTLPPPPDSSNKHLEPENTRTPQRLLKRARSASSPPHSHPYSKKGKAKEVENVLLLKDLTDLEDELTCPICSDFFVAAHVGNPCGHSYCGMCGWQWKQKGKTCCPICRTELIKKCFMIPNFSVDNAVEKYILVLQKGGSPGWEPGGSKCREWEGRKTEWRNSAPQKMEMTVNKPKKRARRTPAFIELI